MKAVHFIIAFIFLSISSQAQMMFDDPYRQEVSTDYTIELVIKYNDHLLSEMVWSYNDKQTLGMQQDGIITLKILDDSERLRALELPSFQIAIRDIKTGTQRMLSNKTYTEIPANEIVEQCKEGENIIIMTTDRKYILRDNLIELLLGC